MLYLVKGLCPYTLRGMISADLKRQSQNPYGFSCGGKRDADRQEEYEKGSEISGLFFGFQSYHGKYHRKRKVGHSINFSKINLSINTAINGTYNTIARENSTTWRPTLSLEKLFFDKSVNTRLSAGYNTSSKPKGI